MHVRSFRDLTVWQRSVDLTKEVYRLSRRFPDEERFVLTSQVRKSSISISANIAEGSGRFTSRDFLNFLSQARGSTKETESHLLTAQALQLLAHVDLARALGFTDEISRMLFNLRHSIRRSNRKAGS